MENFWAPGGVARCHLLALGNTHAQKQTASARVRPTHTTGLGSVPGGSEVDSGLAAAPREQRTRGRLAKKYPRRASLAQGWRGRYTAPEGTQGRSRQLPGRGVGGARKQEAAGRTPEMWVRRQQSVQGTGRPTNWVTRHPGRNAGSLRERELCGVLWAEKSLARNRAGQIGRFQAGDPVPVKARGLCWE